MAFTVVATTGTAAAIGSAGARCDFVHKVNQGRPHVVDRLNNDEIDFIVNTTEGRQAIPDSFTIRRTAVQHKVPYTSTIAAARASLVALRERRPRRSAVSS